ncbi:hypothetical protein AX16_001852 [Volvariella volvacea WC 439]|nr:hypothetical protein AX16_001852 [Volvariella volvacea WC 439]
MPSYTFSKSSSPPRILTEEPVGSDSPEATSSAKKPRRSTAFYPNVNSSNKPMKPFSRSAAKRESVMALGSIEHLQHYFTKAGIAAKRNPLLHKPHHGLVPAIGGLARIRTNPSLGSIAELQLPPSPAVPQPTRPAFPIVPKTYEVDPEHLLPGVIEDLIAVAEAWGFSGQDPTQRHTLGTASNSTNHDRSSSGNVAGGRIDGSFIDAGKGGDFDVLSVLQITTRAVRSVGNYLVSLPDESAETLRANFRPTLLGPDTSKKATITSSSTPSSSKQADPLSLIRRSALEVLTVLRDLEERYRLPLSDEAYDAQSDNGSRSGSSHSRVTSPSAMLEDDEGVGAAAANPGQHGEIDSDSSFTFMRVQGREESIPVWDDEEDVFAEPDEKEERQLWDDKLVLGSGWLYRQDVRLAELEKERQVINTYLDLVDEVIFDGDLEGGSQSKGVDDALAKLEGRESRKAERGWERERRKYRNKGTGSRSPKGRRVSAGDGEGKGLGLFNGSVLEPKRRVSTGMLTSIMNTVTLSDEPSHMGGIAEDEEYDEFVEDDDLPTWAKRSTFVDDDLGRAYALLAAFTPAHLLGSLQSPSEGSRTAFLESLSSGQILCLAYNASVRKSRKPWGFINRDSIHDIYSLEQAAEKDPAAGARTGWTFRRTDNLRLWVGALKLRYLLPLHVPSNHLATPHAGLGLAGVISGSSSPANGNTPLSSPGVTKLKFPTNATEPPVVFDAKIVAKKEEGWEEMLESVLIRWVNKVVDEKRGITK